MNSRNRVQPAAGQIRIAAELACPARSLFAGIQLGDRGQPQFPRLASPVQCQLEMGLFTGHRPLREAPGAKLGASPTRHDKG